MFSRKITRSPKKPGTKDDSVHRENACHFLRMCPLVSLPQKDFEFRYAFADK